VKINHALIVLIIAGVLMSANSSLAEEYQFPDWITKLIEKEKTGVVANPPASLSRCNYKGRPVYYLPPRCCDIPGVLYDENGTVICNPSGGLTGGVTADVLIFSRDMKREIASHMERFTVPDPVTKSIIIIKCEVDNAGRRVLTHCQITKEKHI